MLTGGSLFSGIGGFELGAQLAGVEVDWRWQVEIDPFCRSVLERHHPHTDRSVIDVCEAGAHNLEPVDVIVGGFPCQDISLAGKGAGLAGERSGLWREFVRIIPEVGAQFVLVENVLALVSRGLADVLADLAALGFDAEWCDLRASDVMAGHRRPRLFLVAWRVSDPDSGDLREQQQRDEGRKRGVRHQGQPEPGDVGADLLANADGRGPQRERCRGLLDSERATQRDDADGCGRAPVADTARERRAGWAAKARRSARANAEGHDVVADTQCHRLQGERQTGPGTAAAAGRPAWPPPPDDLHAWGRLPADAQPCFCRMADGLPARVVASRRPRLKALGNSIVPQVAAIAWRRLAEVAHG